MFAPGPFELMIIAGLSMILLPVMIIIIVLAMKNRYKTSSENDAEMYENASKHAAWEEGRLAGETNMIVRVLEYRFKNVPENIVRKTNSISDSKKLEKLIETAVNCETLEQFESSIS